MFFRALTFARSRGSCLNTRPLGGVFKHQLRDLASVNAMKQICVIVILAYLPYLNLDRTENVAYAQVTHSQTGRRISHGYNQASFVAIRIGP